MEPYKNGWSPINEEKIGVSWDSNLGANTRNIIQYESYNGRVQLLDDTNPEARFQMAEKIAIKNKSTEYRDPMAYMQEDSLLATTYFSEANIQIVQNGLRAGVYEMSKKQMVIPPQNIDNLKIIMRSFYLQYAKHSKTEPIRDQIQQLNQYVLNYTIPKVYNEAQGYLNYLRDQSTLVMPMERPQQVDRDYKHLEWGKENPASLIPPPPLGERIV